MLALGDPLTADSVVEEGRGELRASFCSDREDGAAEDGISSAKTREGGGAYSSHGKIGFGFPEVTGLDRGTS